MIRSNMNKWLGIALISCTGLANANLLTNGDFEIQGIGGAQDAAGWFRTNTGIVGRYQEVGQAGHGDYTILIQDSQNNPLTKFFLKRQNILNHIFVYPSILSHQIQFFIS